MFFECRTSEVTAYLNVLLYHSLLLLQQFSYYITTESYRAVSLYLLSHVMTDMTH